MYMYVHVCICMSIYCILYLCICVCVSIYIYIYIYIKSELPWGHWRIGNNRDGTLSVFLTTHTHTHIYTYIWNKFVLYQNVKFSQQVWLLSKLHNFIGITTFFTVNFIYLFIFFIFFCSNKLLVFYSLFKVSKYCW